MQLNNNNIKSTRQLRMGEIEQIQVKNLIATEEAKGNRVSINLIKENPILGDLVEITINYPPFLSASNDPVTIKGACRVIS